MKYLIINLILIIGVAEAKRVNWISIEDGDNCEKVGRKTFPLKHRCEKANGKDKCRPKEKAYNCNTMIYKTYQADDLTRPIYDKTGMDSCTDAADCDSKFITLDCSAGYNKVKNYNIKQVYCVKLTGYVKVDKKGYRIDNDKKAAWDLIQAQKATKLVKWKTDVESLKLMVDQIKDDADLKDYQKKLYLLLIQKLR